MKKIFRLLIFVMMVFIVGIMVKTLFDIKENKSIKIEPVEVVVESSTLSAWIAYWDIDKAEEEIEVLSSEMDSIINFAVYFDEIYEFYIPSNFQKIETMINSDTTKYLSIVNDVVVSDGKNIMKDKEILKSFFESDSSIEKHVDQIFKLLLKYDYNALEIDYENVYGELSKNFAKFIEILNDRCIENDILLRVVLEPKFPYDDVDLPEGPEYVIMFYNLHFNGSDPGPKADDNFIIELSSKVYRNLGYFNSAFSVGGFDWSNGQCVAVTEEKARNIAKEFNAEIIRDETNLALTFLYQVEGVKHEVWFADGVTLSHWMEIAEQYGSKGHTLWRLSGNEITSLTNILEFYQNKKAE